MAEDDAPENLSKGELRTLHQLLRIAGEDERPREAFSDEDIKVLKRIRAIINEEDARLLKRLRETFSEEDFKAIKRLVRDDDRSRWLWYLLRVWVGYTGAIIAALYASWSHIIWFFNALLHAGGHQ